MPLTNQRVLIVTQIASIVLLIALIFIGLLTYRHFTFDIFVPLLSYLQSAKVSMPPLLILIVTIIVAIVSGGPVSKLKEKVLSFLRNTFFQSMRHMCIFIVAALIVLGGMGYILTKTSPPEYANLVAKILGAENDKFQFIDEKLSLIAKVNPVRAENISHVASVFKTREQINSNGGEIDNIAFSNLIRTLETNFENDPGWKVHPLRIHALAEAYSLKADSMKGQADSEPGSPFSSDKLFGHAEELYQQVAHDQSIWATDLLKASAANNIGNIYYYKGQYDVALQWWQKVNAPEFGGPNLASWANVVAGYVLTNRPDNAIREALVAEKWAVDQSKAHSEASNFSGIVGNRGFAHAMKGEYANSLSAFISAYQAFPDEISGFNLALGYVINHRGNDADTLLRKSLTAVSLENQSALALSKNNNKCGYVIWYLAKPDDPAPLSAARLLTALGEAHTANELRGYTQYNVGQLSNRVLAELPKSQGPCGNITLIPAVKEALRSSS